MRTDGLRGRVVVMSAVTVMGAGAVSAACAGSAGSETTRRNASATRRDGGVPRDTGGSPSVSGARAAGSSGRRCGADGRLVPRCGGAWWGVYSARGRTFTSSVTDLEQRIGRRFDIVLRFHDFSTSPGPGRFPDESERALGRSRMLFFAWQSRLFRQGRGYPWRDIAAGVHDASVVRPVARRVRDYRRMVFMSFDPEMDRHMTMGERKGTAAEYVAAARHVHDVFRAVGATNVVWVWTTTGSLGGDNARRILDSYPGDAYADWVGWDPYNFHTCNGTPWRTFAQTVDGTYRFFQRKGFGGKPFMLPEFATQYDPADPVRSRRWYHDIPGQLRNTYPNIRGLVRFDAGPGCGLHIDNGPGMLRSYADAGRAPYLRPSRG